MLPHASRTRILRDTTPTATRYGISSTAHLALVSSTVSAAGGDMEDFYASQATVKRHRKKEQTEIANKIRDSFRSEWKGWPKILHWDGKVMELDEPQGRSYQDVNAAVLSVPGSGSKGMVIGAPTVARGTGQQLARSATDKAAEWTDLADIVGGVFDTTSANTGINEGAMTYIERILNDPMFWIACRHHMAELHLNHPYNLIMHRSTGPDDPLFKAFKKWFVEQKVMSSKT